MNNIINIKMAALAAWVILLPLSTAAATPLPAGYYLQTDSHGELWKIDPNRTLTHLKNPAQDLNIEKFKVSKIDNDKLRKIPVGLLKSSSKDTDLDGLPDNLELALGTDSKNKDSDKDGFDDKTELLNGYDPLSSKKQKLVSDNNAINDFGGTILIDQKTNYWYVDAAAKKRYYIEDKSKIWQTIVALAKSITTKQLESLRTLPQNINQQPLGAHQQLLIELATAIEKKDYVAIDKLMTPNKATQVKFSIDYLTKKSKKLSDFADTYRFASISSQTSTYESYNTLKNASLLNREAKVNTTITKQADGRWLITDL